MARARLALDLFAGAGGATAGLKRAGYRVVAAIELDPAASETFRVNHPEVKLLASDIRDVSPADLRRRLRMSKGSLALLKACPPCQGHSSLGGGNIDDPRNALLDEVWPFIREFQPRDFILENVPGLDRDPRLDRLIRQTRGAGYAVARYRIDAAELGVPQHRVRLIVIGSRVKALPDDLSDIGELLPDSYSRSVSAGMILDRLRGDRQNDGVHVHRQPTAAVLARIRAIPRGGDRFALPMEHRLKCHAKLRAGAASASYGRIIEDEPAPTLTTRCTTPACGRFIHPREHRGLTLREAAALQTFPLTYRFRGNYGEIERQIGNAVPVKLAAALGLLVQRLPDREVAKTGELRR